ncbi:hypothetical protein [Flavobacterium gilvum]|nr:hypothetical protein [Flavobacterium gilvum]KFC60292.1 integrase [Flavobacterium gilvum]
MQWNAKIITHKKEKRIAVYFEKNAEWIARIKNVAGSRWSQTLGLWHIPNTEENRIRFKLTPYRTQSRQEKALPKSKNSSNGYAPNPIAKVPSPLIAKP